MLLVSHVKKHFGRRHEVQQLTLDDGCLVLPRAPDVRDKRVILVLARERDWWSLAIPETERTVLCLPERLDDDH